MHLLQGCLKLLRITLSLILEVLARVRAILKKGPVTVEQAAAAQSSQCPTRESDTSTTCYKCDGPNHLAWNCLFRYKPTQKRGEAKTKIPVPCYKCKKQGHSLGVSGKRVRWWNFGASFFPKSPVNKALPMVSMRIDEEPHSACGYWLHSNPVMQVMLSYVGKKGGSPANCWWEFTDVLWSECDPNWYCQ